MAQSWISQRIADLRTQLRRSAEAPDPTEGNKYALQALERHKAEGMRLAVRARLIALVVIMALLLIINPQWATLYYVAFAGLFALNGWAQLRVARVGRSRTEVLLLALDLLLLTVVIVTPNPFDNLDQPLAMQYRFSGHMYFFVYLALGTLAYSARTVRGYGSLAAIIWLLGVAAAWLISGDHWSIKAVSDALQSNPVLAEVLDPGNIRFDMRIQEVVVFAVVAFILSMTVNRFGGLLLEHAATERERTNLARYFSPNLVEELSRNDEPLKRTKIQNVAVLFVDIVGFTSYSNRSEPEEVISTLRAFHRLMETCVFDHEGTLDKFLGDGLMATFGTPVEGDRDALNALQCAQAMISAVETWNDERTSEGKEPIRIGLGLHYGPCVLGDIGGENRLEFAVIGDTVNVASRVEAKTRELDVDIAMTEAVAEQVRRQEGSSDGRLNAFKRFDRQEIRGVAESVTLFGARTVGTH